VFKTNPNTRNLRSVLLLGAASAAAIGLGTPAAAQQAAGGNGGNVETVVVTGSRIPQTGIYSASPVTAVGQQELKFEGTTDVTSLLNNLPEAFVDQNQGEANGATGTANVDLRGLGAKRTLVLVNGTRLMPGDPGDPVADLNDIPAALVDHVEVLTGGASAVYGSDALAGVVNFIMRKDFEGIELDGTYSITNNDNDTSRWRDLTAAEAGAYGFAQSKEGIWNGGTTDATLIMGTNTANDKGNVTAYIGYRDIQPVLEASRDYSECTIASLNKTTGGTSTSPYTGSTCQGSSNYARFIDFDNLYSGHSWDYFEQGKNPTGNFVPYTGSPEQHFNYGALNYFQRPDTRYTGGFFAHYEENKELDIYSSFMFSDDYTVAQIAQSGFFLASGQGPSDTVYINCNNPYMTALENYDMCGQIPGDKQVTVTLPNGKPFTYWNGAGNATAYSGNPYGVAGQANLWIGRRDTEGPYRQDDLRHTAYRAQIGARGDLGDGWTYDIYAQYGETLFNENYTGEFSKTRTQDAIEVDPTTGKCYSAESQNGLPPTAPNCVPINIFTGFGSISPQALNYVLADGFQEGFTQEQIVSGSLTGDLGEWGIQSPWAKNPVAISVGAEYRNEELKLATDQEFTTNDLYGQGAATLSVPQSGFDVSEGFTEIKVPLVQGMPYFEDLSLNGGYRYSSYNTAGSTNTYKYGAEWQPIDDFRLRGSIQRAVRAPNVLELFAPANVELFSGQDPCTQALTNPVVYNNCVHNKYAPVPVSAITSNLVSCPATQCDVQVGGNTALKPEVSSTRTGGVVFTPTFLDGFTATFDWFDIKVDNYISVLPPQEILDECYGATATAASMSYFCPFVHRNGAGTVYGTTGYVSALNLNTGFLETRGLDYEFNYQTDLSSWGAGDMGSLAFNDIGTYLTGYINEPVPITPATRSSVAPYNCAGMYGLTCGTIAEGPAPKWRNKLRVTWTSPWDVDFSAQWRYIGGVSLDADSTNPLIGGSAANSYTCNNGLTIHGIEDCPDARIAPYDYFDLSADWTVREGVDLRAGVNNIFDIEPPVIGSQALPIGVGNGNTFTGIYDYLGRTVFVAATIKY